MKILVNHLGFKPCDHSKLALIQGETSYREFAVVDLTEMGYNEIGPNSRENAIVFRGALKKQDSCWGTYTIADFSDLKKPGIYLITIDNKYNSVPFQIREDLYSRTLRKAYDYIHIQRCGEAVLGYHGPCHLDDALIRETGEYVETTGGWHDAGDLRKWMEHTMLLGIAICKIKRNINPMWHDYDRNEGDLLNELRWGNKYFLKMQDQNGMVWNDVGAGVNGDNSDNHWTDNKTGTADDRHINTAFNPVVQWEFIYLQAMITDLFKEVDQGYARESLTAAEKGFNYIKERPNLTASEMAWAVLACREMYNTTRAAIYYEKLTQELQALIDLQESEFQFNQEKVRGFWYSDTGKTDFFRGHRDTGSPLIALCHVIPILEQETELRTKCLQAIKLYCYDYIVPMVKTNPFNIIPFGLFAKEITDEKYRQFAGELKYRFFSPTKVEFYQGITSHLLSNAVGLEMAGRILADENLSGIAKSQVEWIMGRNTENACLMTAEGINNPYPHSRFLGLIPGGIMNGFIGLEDDEPFLDMQYTMDWRTTEYWSPHTCFYIWWVSLMK